MHLDTINCGQGAPSLYLIYLAGIKKIPGTLVITADTGAERDMLWSTGRRSDAATFFNEVTKPLAEEFGLEAVFVRSRDKHGNELPPLDEAHQFHDYLDIPLFGDEGGRLDQSCTSKWKIAAIRQEARRRGAKTMMSALGMTMDEVHRIKRSDVQWHQHYYPLIFDFKMYRAEIIEHMIKLGIPYLVSTQCDCCPHKDKWRWLNTSPKTIEELDELEAVFRKDGLYLTKSYKPIKQFYIELVEAAKAQTSFFDEGFGCPEGGYCGMG